MNGNVVLREKAREGIRIGKLPSRTPTSTWGGRGEDKACAVCDTFVSRQQAEIEVEFKADDGLAGHSYHMHVPCFAAWAAERALVAAAGEAAPPGNPANGDGLRGADGALNIPARDTEAAGTREPG